jgi:hypothetical protein
LNISEHDWVSQQMVIACRWGLQEEILELDPWEMLDSLPEGYFVGDGDEPPSMVIPRYIEVTVIGELAFDVRNIQKLNGWAMKIDDQPSSAIEEGVELIRIEGQPKAVVFLYNDSPQLFFNLFYKEE